MVEFLCRNSSFESHSVNFLCLPFSLALLHPCTFFFFFCNATIGSGGLASPHLLFTLQPNLQNHPELRAERGVGGPVVGGIRHQQSPPEPAGGHHGITLHLAPCRQRPHPGPVARDQPQATGGAGGHIAEEHHSKGTSSHSVARSGDPQGFHILVSFVG